MGWLQTDQCCCCIPIRTGGIILGWFGMIYGILGIVAYALRWDFYMTQLAVQNIAPPAALALSVISLIISGLYLLGIFKKSALFMFPSVILNFIGIFAAIVYFILTFVLTINVFRAEDVEKGVKQQVIVLLVGWWILIILAWHFTAVQCSLCSIVEDEEADAESGRNSDVYRSCEQEDSKSMRSTSAGWLSTNCCCGCISVRSGCIILGWLGVIGGIVGIGGYFFNSNYYIEQLAAHNIPPGWGLAACVINLIVSGLFLYGIFNKKTACMIPEILLSFISIFVALIAFIIRLVWGIKAMYSEMDRNVKLQSFPIVIFWFLLMILLWHFTAVSCSLCKNIEVEVEEEAEFRRTGERRNRYDDEC